MKRIKSFPTALLRIGKMKLGINFFGGGGGGGGGIWTQSNQRRLLVEAQHN